MAAFVRFLHEILRSVSFSQNPIWFWAPLSVIDVQVLMVLLTKMYLNSIAFKEKRRETHNFWIIEFYLVRRSSNFRTLSAVTNKTGTTFFFKLLSSKIKIIQIWVGVSDLKHDKLRKNSYVSTYLVDTSHFCHKYFSVCHYYLYFALKSFKYLLSK